MACEDCAGGRFSDRAPHLEDVEHAVQGPVTKYASDRSNQRELGALPARVLRVEMHAAHINYAMVSGRLGCCMIIRSSVYAIAIMHRT